MTVSFLALALIVVLLAVPAYVFYAYDIGLSMPAIKAIVRMLGYLSVVGILLYLLSSRNNAILNVVFTLTLTLFSAFVITTQARLSVSKHFLTILLGTAIPTLAVSALLTLALDGGMANFSSQTLLIITGILSGCIVGPCSKGMSAYYTGVRNHGQLYYFLVGNGATRKEALKYLQQRAITRAALPGMKHMASLFVGTTPLVLWSLLLTDIGVLEAVTFQILLLVASWCTGIAATLCTLLIIRRWGIDAYSRLK